MEHDDIMQAIREHNPQRAESLMEAHMQAILDEVEKQVEEFDENNEDLPRWIR